MKKGALVELVSGLNSSVPNVVIFQFNPETLRHSVSHAMKPMALGEQAGSHPLAVAGEPSESFSFNLELDVTDDLADPNELVVASATIAGVYPRLAALEQFVHPANVDPFSSTAKTPAAVLPTVLFVWNVGRILPVRVSSLSITEQLFDTNLNPTHAEVSIELSVLTEDELRPLAGAGGEIARKAYEYTQLKRVALVAANLATSGKALIDMVVQEVGRG